MGQPLSMDLRTPLLAAIDAGMSCRGAAASTAIRWQAQRRARQRRTQAPGWRHALTPHRAPPHHAEKRTGHAIEQDRPDVLRQRQAWFEGQFDLDPERLVFIDETWTATNMARSHGRCRRGQRLRMGFPHGHRRRR